MEYRNQVKADLAKTGSVVDVGKNPILEMPPPALAVIVSGNQGTVFINEIPVVTPVDNVETADSGGGEQINFQVLDNTRTFCGNQMRNYILQFQNGILSLQREIKYRATE